MTVTDLECSEFSVGRACRRNVRMRHDGIKFEHTAYISTSRSSAAACYRVVRILTMPHLPIIIGTQVNSLTLKEKTRK